MDGERKRVLWLQAMATVAGAHHQLIVNEYHRLLVDNGVGVVDEQQKSFVRTYILGHLRHDGTPQKIQAIQAARAQFGLGLKEAKDIADAVCATLEKEGHITPVY